MMSYSIIVQSKKKDLFDKCIASIKSKLKPELIVIDVGGVLDAVRNANEFGSVQFLTIDPAKSCGAGINMGFKAAKYDHMIYLQDDCECEPYALDKLFDEYKRHDYGLMSPNIQEPNNTRELNEKIQDKIIQLGRSHFFIGRVFACFITSKHFFQLIGDIDEQFYPLYYDDTDYFYRMKLRELFRIGLVCNAVVTHHARGTLKQYDEGKMRGFDKNNKKLYIKKWGGPPRNEVYDKPYG